MNQELTRSRLNVLVALIADTFEEARARWLFWGLFGLSTLLIGLFLFALNIDLSVGAISVMDLPQTARPVYNIHKFVNVSYSWTSLFLYIWGTFLAIFASSGLIPSVLEPGRISLLLSKPLQRTTFLLGRYMGNLLVVALNHVYLILGIWLILGYKTSIWEPRFLLAIPISLFMFAVLLCVVVLVGVVFESSALSVMLAVALMLLSTLLAQRDFVIRLLDSEWSRQLWMVLYWIVPKVYDLGYTMKQIVLYDRQADWLTPVWTSAAFGIAALGGALSIFRKRDF
ncbi:MAG: ABC transporter permease subunit [Acidobacteriaceae bacterium]|nr:ABC transporter permease subunit [Acidobacteriaceae bacterium]